MEQPLKGLSDFNAALEEDVELANQNPDFTSFDISNLSQLEPKDRAIAESLVHILGQKLILMLYNKSWGVRQKAFMELQQGIKSFDFANMPRAELQSIFMSLLAVVNKGCSDKIANVNIEAVALFL